MTPVNYDLLYELSDPFSNRFFRGSVRLPPDIDRNALLTGKCPPEGPITIGRAEGRSLADFVWTDNIAIVLIRERVAAALRAARFSGWSTYPLELDAESARDQYVGLTVTGRCGPPDYTRGEWVRKDDEPGRFLRGLCFDEQSWDGSDFFLSEGTLHMFVTERVRDCLKREGVQNVRCERLSDVTTSELVIRNTPRR